MSMFLVSSSEFPREISHITFFYIFLIAPSPFFSRYSFQFYQEYSFQITMRQQWNDVRLRYKDRLSEKMAGKS